MEEAASLDVIKTLPFGAFHMHGVDAKRRVVRFGLHYVAGSAALTPASDFRFHWSHCGDGRLLLLVFRHTCCRNR
jgi:hypothetical protein